MTDFDQLVAAVLEVKHANENILRERENKGLPINRTKKAIPAIEDALAAARRNDVSSTKAALKAVRKLGTGAATGSDYDVRNAAVDAALALIG